MTPPIPDGRWSWWAGGATAALYLLTAAAVIVNRLRHERRQRLQNRFERIRIDQGTGADGQRTGLRDALDKAPLSTLRHLITERSVSRALRAVVAHALLERLGEQRILRDAGSGGRKRDGWRRIVALHTLVHARPLESLDSLQRALADGGPAVVGEAVMLLGQLPDPRAAEILVRALAEGRGTRSRIATALDVFPIDVADRIVPMLTSDKPAVRYWGAMLMQRYAARPGVGAQLETLASDREPLVRRAAIESIAAVGGPVAVAAARARLSDAVSFVRAHAARTLGILAARDAVEAVLPLLADEDWWVRYAVKQSLEAMGLEIADAIVPYLSHADAFARNGAAEVLQNLGAFERLLVQEASASPDPQRLATLGLLARAGGVRMWDSVLARLDGAAQARARQVLADIQLDASHSEQRGA